MQKRGDGNPPGLRGQETRGWSIKSADCKNDSTLRNNVVHHSRRRQNDWLALATVEASTKDSKARDESV